MDCSLDNGFRILDLMDGTVQDVVLPVTREFLLLNESVESFDIYNHINSIRPC